MSYDIELLDPKTKKVIELSEPHFIRGGTYAIGGTKRLELNITYSYSKHFKHLGKKGIRSIYGKKAKESIPILMAAAFKLKSNVVEDYWEATEGNAKWALMQLISIAEMRPDGIWDGD
jgi:hypothetical protein